jgi:hypothetical protein
MGEAKRRRKATFDTIEAIADATIKNSCRDAVGGDDEGNSAMSTHRGQAGALR